MQNLHKSIKKKLYHKVIFCHSTRSIQAFRVENFYWIMNFILLIKVYEFKKNYDFNSIELTGFLKT